jgi:chromate transporter
LATRLWQLAKIFLKLGTIGFGGPQAHIAMQNDETVVRRPWLTPEQFAEGMAMCEMLPGPASTQMGIYIGYLRAGQLGALVTGFCFIAPAFVIVVILSWGYFRFQGLPQITDLFLGISPVVTAIILAFCWKLGQKAVKDWRRGAIASTVFLLSRLTSISVLLQFIGAGLIGLIWFRPKPPQSGTLTQASQSKALLQSLLGLPFPLILAQLPVAPLALSSFWGWERISAFALPLTLFFLKVGSFIFGGGLVIIPLLESEVVEKLHWLTSTEFINGVAIGQLSPGPVVLTAAFVGYKVAGILGALVSTLAIFAPSFAFIMVAAPALVRIRQNPWIQAFLQGVTPGVLGAIAAAAVPLAQTTLEQDSWQGSIVAGAIGIGALVGLLHYKLPTWQLVPGGALLGLLAGWLLGV